MEQSYAASELAAYQRAVVEVREKWTRQLGPPQDSATAVVPTPMNEDSVMVHLLVWRSDRATTALEFGPQGSNRGAVLLRAVVQDSRMPLRLSIPTAEALESRGRPGG
jgi:hypothetical protein